MEFRETKRIINISRYENELYIDGYETIAGVDEAGRGSLAGPLVAAAVIMDRKKMMIEDINDSKKLTEAKRRVIFKEIIKNCLCWSAKISPDEIDRMSINKANVVAFEKAVGSLKIKPNIILADFVNAKMDVKYLQIIKGDSLSVSIASASIIAKVIRDDIMLKLSKYYPEYGFENNKGYGTRQHLVSLQKFGPSMVHRMSFRGVLS